MYIYSWDDPTGGGTVHRKLHLPKWVSEYRSKDSPNVLYSPKAIVLLSHWPYYDFFIQVLRQFLRLSRSKTPIPLERYISNLIYDVPLPPRGGTQVQHTIADRTFYIKRPLVSEHPRMFDGDFRILFRLLTIDTIVSLFTCVFTEMKVAIKSRHHGLLTVVWQTIRQLLFPFEWQG